MTRIFSKNVKAIFYKSKTKKILEEIDSLRNADNKESEKVICSCLKELSEMKYQNCLNLKNCILENAVLKNIQLSKVCFWNADLKGVDFSNAVLPEADFWNANLFQANLENTILTDATFTHSNLQQVNLKNSDLRRAKLEESNLEGADLSGANLKWAKIELYQLKSVKSLTNTTMPDGTNFSDGWAKIIETTPLPNSKN